MSDNNKDQEVPYSSVEDPGYSSDDFEIYQSESDRFNDYVNEPGEPLNPPASENDVSHNPAYHEPSDVGYLAENSSGDGFLDFVGSAREPWSDEKEEILKLNLIDFVSSFHRGKPILGRSNLLMGMAAELELPFEHKLMDAVYELGEHKKIVGYPALVQFMNNLGYFGFAEPDLDPALDPDYDPGHITAEDVRRINDRLPDEIKSDPEQMKRYRDNETATEISEKLSENEISRDEIEGLIGKFNSKNSAIFYRTILDSVLSGEIPPGHYRYFDEHDPVSFAEAVISESKSVNNDSVTINPDVSEKPAFKPRSPQFESYKGEDFVEPRGGSSEKNNSLPSARKFDGDNGNGQSVPSGDKGHGLHRQSPGGMMPHHRPFDLTEMLVNVSMGVLNTPFALMGGVGAIYNASAKGSYNKLLNSKISAMESSQANIKSAMGSLKSGLGENGLPLSESEKSVLTNSIDENLKCYRNRIRDVSDMCSSKHLDAESGKKINDAMADAKSFADEVSKDDSEIGKKYKEMLESLTKVIEMIMRIFGSKKDSGSPVPG